MEGEAPFLKNGGFPLQTTPFSQKLLNNQQRRGAPLNTVHLSFVVQTLSRLKGLVLLFKECSLTFTKQKLFAIQFPALLTFRERKRGRGPRFLRELLLCLCTLLGI